MVTRPSICSGSWALIWPGDAKSIGMAEPPTVRQDAPIAVGNGISDVAMLTGFKFVPKTAIRDPGATGLVRSAAFTTRSIVGGGTGVSKFQDKAVKPDAVRAIM